MTDRQKRVLAAVVSLTGYHGYPPSLRQLMVVLGITSTNGVVCHLTALAAKGYIEHPRYSSASPGAAAARCVVVPELRAALAAAARSYLDGLGPPEGGA